MEGDAFLFNFNSAINVCLTECYVNFAVNSLVVPHESPKCLVVSNGKANSTMLLFGISHKFLIRENQSNKNL